MFVKMSVSLRSKIFPFFTFKFNVCALRSISCMTSFNSSYNGASSLILGGSRKLIKTNHEGINTVDVKRLTKQRFFGDDIKMTLNRDAILSLCDNLANNMDKDNHLFHTMTKRYDKAGCKSKDAMNSGRVKYHKELEDAINKQIMAELNVAFVYLSMASFFGRPDVGKHGTHRFFMVLGKEEIQHAQKFIEYQLSRGGILKLSNISVNESVEMCSIAKALEMALEIEITNTDEICNIVCLAQKHKDVHAENLLISEFVTEQYESITKIACLLSRANRIGKCGIGDHIIDSELMKNVGHSSKSSHSSGHK